MKKIRKSPVPKEEEDEQYEIVEDGGLPPEIEELKKENDIADYKVHVRLKTPNSNKFEKIPEVFTADGFGDGSFIAQQYGGGTYRFTLRDPSGQYVQKWTTDYASKKVDNAPNQLMPTIIQQQKDETSKKMIDLLQEEMRATREEMKSSREESKLTLIELIKTMNKPQEVQPQRDVVGEFLKLQQLLPKSDGGSKLTDFLEMFKITKDIVGDAHDSGGSTTDLVIKKFAEAIIPKVVERLKGGIDSMSIPSNQLPSVQRDNQLPSEQVKEVKQKSENEIIVEENPNDKVVKCIRNILPNLMESASKGTPVQVTTDYLYSALSESDFILLQDYLRNNGLEKLLNNFPELNQYKSWIESLIHDLVTYFSREETDDENQPET